MYSTTYCILKKSLQVRSQVGNVLTSHGLLLDASYNCGAPAGMCLALYLDNRDLRTLDVETDFLGHCLPVTGIGSLVKTWAKKPTKQKLTPPCPAKPNINVNSGSWGSAPLAGLPGTEVEEA